MTASGDFTDCPSQGSNTGGVLLKYGEGAEPEFARGRSGKSGDTAEKRTGLVWLFAAAEYAAGRIEDTSDVEGKVEGAS